jgi:hypothetical protein
MPASPSPSRTIKRAAPARRRWPLIIVGLLLALVAVVFVLPASMMAHFLPAPLRAEDFSGSLLHGAAGRISVNGRDAGAVEWQLHPLSLLGLSVVADIHWVKVGFVLDGTVQIARQRFAAHDLRGGGPIEGLRDIGLAAGWRGNANIAIAAIESDYGKLLSAAGKIEVANLSAQNIAQGEELGAYALQLEPGAVAADGTVTAHLNDMGGPLEVRAQIRFAPAQRTGTLSGTLNERPEASAALRNQLAGLAQLARPDSTGRFPVELEFTL